VTRKNQNINKNIQRKKEVGLAKILTKIYKERKKWAQLKTKN